MAKRKRILQQSHPSRKSPKQPKTNNQKSPSANNKTPAASSTVKKAPQASKPLTPTIPFDPLDHILLIGEGDLSFASSLVHTHGCASLVATVFDSQEQLESKYPQAISHAESIVAEGQTVLYGVDATKLTQKEIRRGQRWDRIVFNFPHVGGKSKDVNRQVRYNQEMLVSFFAAATPLLAPGGTIIITLFEGEPYTLWNIRDLARHSGALEVQRSFKFAADAYPGYSHARTLGNIEGGGGWKGEDRAARSYVFQAKAVQTQTQSSPVGGKKRKRGGEDASDSEG